MSKTVTLPAEARSQAGKGAARATRRAGHIPAVIYGDKQPAVNISLTEKEALKLANDPGLFTHTFDVVINGEKTHAVVRDMQLHPVTDRPMHFDFLRVGPETVITVLVPVHFAHQDASPGIKRGGVLNIVAHELHIAAKADSMPEEIVVDLTGKNVGDSVHVSDAVLPAGAVCKDSPKKTIATITAPSALKSADGAAA